MKPAINTMIVDDEPLAREDLLALLQEFPEINVTAQAGSVSEAQAILKKPPPDLIFLDIQMPGETGFELLPHVSSDTQIIFVTAYDDYAIRAFEVNAQDYLLKPVNRQRLKLSIDRLRQGIPDQTERLSRLNRHDSLLLKLHHSYRFLKLTDLVKINAADDYTELVFEDGTAVLTHRSMKSWESRLPDTIFCRVHRSSIINIEKVERIEPWHNRSYRILLKGQRDAVVLSRRCWQQLKEKLGY